MLRILLDLLDLTIGAIQEGLQHRAMFSRYGCIHPQQLTAPWELRINGTGGSHLKSTCLQVSAPAAAVFDVYVHGAYTNPSYRNQRNGFSVIPTPNRPHFHMLQVQSSPEWSACSGDCESSPQGQAHLPRLDYGRHACRQSNVEPRVLAYVLVSWYGHRDLVPPQRCIVERCSPTDKTCVPVHEEVPKYRVLTGSTSIRTR